MPVFCETTSLVEKEVSSASYTIASYTCRDVIPSSFIHKCHTGERQPKQIWKSEKKLDDEGAGAAQIALAMAAPVAQPSLC
jgi:hypothetical protein